MNFGFNSNVRVGDAIYHVQSEDRGASHPYLDTVVYQAGRVIYKRSTSYEDLVTIASAESLAQQLRQMISLQHQEVIAELESGAIPEQTQAKPQPEVASPIISKDGLDVRLSNPKTWLSAGRVTLEIDLLQRASSQKIGGADVEAFFELEKQRTPCARARANAEGHATLKFPMPPNASDGAALVIRATDGSLYGELRFQLKAKAREPQPISK